MIAVIVEGIGGKMKVYYQDKEVGLHRNITRVIEMFGDGIKVSPKHIIACRCNNEVKDLNYKIKEGDRIELLDVTNKDGLRVYRRGALYIMSMAFKQLYPEARLIINYQLAGGTFCECENLEINDEVIENLKRRINEIIQDDLEIKKVNMSKQEAEKFFEKNDDPDERGKLQVGNKNKDVVTLYFCEDYYNFFFGAMPLSTGYINLIDVNKHKDGFIVRYPDSNKPTQLEKFKESKKLLSTLQEYEEIHKLMQISTVQELNNFIEKGKGKDIILTSEALQEKKIAEIADKVCRHKKIKMVLIAGPSSSSKTTFARRLCMQLRVNGIRPYTIGIDDYLVERKDNPVDENGEYDFETIDAIDLKLFNDHLTKLLNGETVEIPKFDFKTGTKRYGENRFLHLDEEEILVIEGIHGLNNKLTSKIPKENKFKIYISDLTVLNFDYYNRISPSDTRLIRRIVRDYKYRGYSALETIKRWASVTRGERKHIYPFQEEADIMYNSSLVYELAVLAKYAIPLLKEIDNTHKEYSEAKRIYSLLEYFYEIDENPIPNNSLLREFIGGSVFDY